MAALVRRCWLATLLLLAGCQTSMEVDASWDPNARFDALRTWSWRDLRPLESDDARASNTFVDARVRAAVERELTARGFDRVADRVPDFFVAYDVRFASGVQTTSVPNRRMAGAHDWSYVLLDRVETEYTDGSLMLDMLEPRTGALLWRGAAHARLEGTGGTPEERTARIDEAVSKILDLYPPP